MGEQEFWRLMMDWGYLAVALAVLIEGEIFLIMVGIATATTLFSYPLVIIAATIGAIVHDNGIFIFSKIAGKKFIEKRPHWQKKNRPMVILPFLMSLRSVHLLNSFISYHSRRKTS